MSYQRMIEDMDAERLGVTDELQKTRFVEGLALGLTGAQAAREAGYSERDIRTPGKIIAADELRARFQEIAQRKGLTLDRVADKIAEHMEARANQTLEGKQVTQSEAPDYRVQQKAVDQLVELIGLKEAKSVGGGSSVSITVSGPLAERMAAHFQGDPHSTL